MLNRRQGRNLLTSEKSTSPRSHSKTRICGALSITRLRTIRPLVSVASNYEKNLVWLVSVLARPPFTYKPTWPSLSARVDRGS